MDTPIADSVFAVRIPRGATVLKGNVGVPARYPKTLSPASPEWVRRAMQGRLDCPHGGVRKAYAPAQVPKVYRLLWAGISSDVEGRCKAAYVHYVKPSTGDTIVLVQSVSKPAEQGEVITDDGFNGSIRTRNVPYPYSVLTWRKGDYYFTMTASSVATSELLRIAKSLQQVNRL